jgi:hypothetical protein
MHFIRISSHVRHLKARCGSGHKAPSPRSRKTANKR